MNFTTTKTSVACECGGRHNNVPSIKHKHIQSYKHTTWRFQCLCAELLTLTDRREKIRCLLELRELVRTGKVQ